MTIKSLLSAVRQKITGPDARPYVPPPIISVPTKRTPGPLRAYGEGRITVRFERRTIRAWAALVDARTKKEISERIYCPLVHTQKTTGKVSWVPAKITLNMKPLRARKRPRLVRVAWFDKPIGGSAIISLNHDLQGYPWRLYPGDSLRLST